MVGLYCRVSTDEQAEHGFSIDNQKERLIAFCKSQGWDEYRLYVDDGYTGTNTNRPALKRLVKHITDGKIKHVVVYKLDRLGRKQKDVLNLLEDVFEKHGVGFKSATEPFDTSPFGKAMLGILSVFAQLERDMIIERTTSGRRQRIRKGIWPGGVVPFGYKWIKSTKTLEKVPEEAKLIQDIDRLYLQGRSLNELGVWAAERNTARNWSHVTIRDILDSPLYAAYLMVNGELVDGNHEPIRTRETWEEIKRERARRREELTPSGDYLLSGLLRCGLCGGPVIHMIRRDRKYGKVYEYNYYVCRRQHHRPKNADYPPCKLGYFREQEIEQKVIEELMELSLDADSVQREITAAQDKVQDDQTSEIRDNLSDQLAEIERKLERWYDAFEIGMLDPAQLKTRVSALEEQKNALNLRLEDMEEEDPRMDRSGDIAEAIQMINQAWEYMTLEERQAVLREAIIAIVLYPSKEFTFEWNV